MTRIMRPANARSSTGGIRVVENSRAICFDVFYEKSPLCAIETHGYERAFIENILLLPLTKKGVGFLSDLLVRAAPCKRAYSLTCIDFFDEQMFIETLLQVETRGLGECPATGQYDRWRKGT